jgi:hypothetical protein
VEGKEGFGVKYGKRVPIINSDCRGESTPLANFNIDKGGSGKFNRWGKFR